MAEGDRAPDFEVKVWLSPAGYQADFYQEGKEVSSFCRSFTGSMEHKDITAAWLRIESLMMLERLRKVVV